MNKDGAVIKVSKRCPLCNQDAEVVVESGPLLRWMRGALVTDAFSDMSIDDQEILISGTHKECWEKAFKEME
jgi:hypothetical protein